MEATVGFAGFKHIVNWFAQSCASFDALCAYITARCDVGCDQSTDQSTVQNRRMRMCAVHMILESSCLCLAGVDSDPLICNQSASPQARSEDRL
jgi:hypothetical protein